MLTYHYNKPMPEGRAYYEGTCLSTDTKPTGNNIYNGSKLMEIDTSTLYVFDQQSKTWKAWGKNV